MLYLINTKNLLDPINHGRNQGLLTKYPGGLTAHHPIHRLVSFLNLFHCAESD